MFAKNRFNFSLVATLIVLSSIRSFAFDLGQCIGALHQEDTPHRGAMPPTNSMRFQSLENLESGEVHSLVAVASQRLKNQLKSSHELQAVKNWIWKLYDTPTVKKVVAPGFKLVDQGLGKPMEIIRELPDGSAKILFQTRNKKRLIDFKVNDDNTLIALSWQEKGSTDSFGIQIVEVATGQSSEPHLFSGAPDTPFEWGATSQVLVDSEAADGSSQIESIDAKSNVRTVFAVEAGGISKKSHYVVFQKENITVLLDSNTGIEIALSNDLKRAKVIGTDKSEAHLIFKTASQGVHRFYSYDIQSGKENLFLTIDKEVPILTSVVDNRFFAYTTNQGKRSLAIFDLEGKLIQSIAIPIEFTVSKVENGDSEQSVKLTLSGPLVEKYKTEFLVGSEPPLEAWRSAMSKNDEVEAKTDLVYVKTKDGWDLPVRIVSKEGVELDGQRPVFMPAYGGFNISGYFEPSFRKEYSEFLKAGGILVFPVIRGGGELGEAGHNVGKGSSRLATSAKDLITVAQYLVSAKITQPKKIAIQGTSNGGRLVATAGLMSPESFGLVVSINGVHDLMGRDYLDEKNDFGWNYEYGNSHDPKDYPYIMRLSNVESPYDGSVNMLIVNGRNDTRVHPAHSLKLYASMAGQNNENVALLTLNNSGHWMEKTAYQGVIGWWTSSVIWTAIFEVLDLHPNWK